MVLEAVRVQRGCGGVEWCGGACGVRVSSVLCGLRWGLGRSLVRFAATDAVLALVWSYHGCEPRGG